MEALAAAHAAPALARVVLGAGRDGSPAADVRLVVRGAWEGIRLFDVRVGPGEIPRGCLLNHVVTLNSGPGGDSHFDALGWLPNCTPRGVSVYPADVPYAGRVHRACSKLAVELAPEIVASIAASEPAGAVGLGPCVGVQDPFAEHVILALAEVARTDADPRSAAARALVTALVHHLLRRGRARQAGHGGALPFAKLRGVADYVDAHLDRAIPLADLAALVGMDVPRFVRAFKRSTGLPPHRYVLQARVERAKRLLADRTLSIGEVALGAGFASPSHFATVFRRLTSATPRRYRDAAG